MLEVIVILGMGIVFLVKIVRKAFSPKLIIIVLLVMIVIVISQNTNEPIKTTMVNAPNCWLTTVYRGDVRLSDGPGLNYPVMETSYSEGVKAHLIEENEGWVKVEMPDGKQGWAQFNLFIKECKLE